MDQEAPKPIPFCCLFCGEPLPISLAKDLDERELELLKPRSLGCIRCGARYWGAIWQNVPKDLVGKVRVVET